MKKPVPGIHHAAICTADVERSMKFWRDGLGFAELFDHTFTGDWPELFGAKTDRLRSIFLGDPKTPDTGIVELVVFEGADADGPPAPPDADGATPPPAVPAGIVAADADGAAPPPAVPAGIVAADADGATPPPAVPAGIVAARRPRHGFFLLSLQREVDETLTTLAVLGFADGVRRISVPAPGGKTVPMAVITAPDGVLVELIGPPR